MDVFFIVQKIEDDNDKIEITNLKFEVHALVYLETYCNTTKSG